MSYSTNRAAGGAGVYSYTLANVRHLRRWTRDPNLPVHVIGGLAGGLSDLEARAAVQAAADSRSVGASFYNFASTTPGEWRALLTWFAPAP
jgi:hypothetical protein